MIKNVFSLWLLEMYKYIAQLENHRSQKQYGPTEIFRPKAV